MPGAKELFSFFMDRLIIDKKHTYTPRRVLAYSVNTNFYKQHLQQLDQREGLVDDFDIFFLRFIRIFAIFNVKSVAKVRERPAVAEIRPYSYL